MHIIQAPLFDFEAFIADKGNDRLVMILEALPAERLIAALERERWTGPARVSGARDVVGLDGWGAVWMRAHRRGGAAVAAG